VSSSVRLLSPRPYSVRVSPDYALKTKSRLNFGGPSGHVRCTIRNHRDVAHGGSGGIIEGVRKVLSQQSGPGRLRAAAGVLPIRIGGPLYRHRRQQSGELER
jgi:hypothetical protein